MSEIWEALPEDFGLANGRPYVTVDDGRSTVCAVFTSAISGGDLPYVKRAHLIAAAPDMLESLDPETLEAIADEIDCFTHSARAAGLRGIAKRQRAAIAKATGAPS